MSEHFVIYTIESSDRPRPQFECRAAVDAPCRSYCQTCTDEERERCTCDDLDRQPNITHSRDCNYLNWLSDDPDEYYDGPKTAVRGPDPQPITLAWEGDYYTWVYAS